MFINHIVTNSISEVVNIMGNRMMLMIVVILMMLMIIIITNDNDTTTTTTTTYYLLLLLLLLPTTTTTTTTTYYYYYYYYLVLLLLLLLLTTTNTTSSTSTTTTTTTTTTTSSSTITTTTTTTSNSTITTTTTSTSSSTITTTTTTTTTVLLLLIMIINNNNNYYYNDDDDYDKGDGEDDEDEYYDQILADNFCHYFFNKVTKIRDDIDTELSSGQCVQHCELSSVPVLTDFAKTSISEIKRVVMNSPTSSCELDPIPTALLKECIDDFAPYITDFVNKSLRCASFPASMQQALVKPLLKKPNLDRQEFASYRPVANLSFLIEGYRTHSIRSSSVLLE